MVQDTGLGAELFEAVSADGKKVLMYGAEEEGPSAAAVRPLPPLSLRVGHLS